MNQTAAVHFTHIRVLWFSQVMSPNVEMRPLRNV